MHKISKQKYVHGINCSQKQKNNKKKNKEEVELEDEGGFSTQ